MRMNIDVGQLVEGGWNFLFKMRPCEETITYEIHPLRRVSLPLPLPAPFPFPLPHRAPSSAVTMFPQVVKLYTNKNSTKNKKAAKQNTTSKNKIKSCKANLRSDCVEPKILDTSDEDFRPKLSMYLSIGP